MPLPPLNQLGPLGRLFTRPAIPIRRPGNLTDAERFAGPIRGELLGSEGLAEHARALARQQRLAPATMRTGLFAPGVRPLLKRLDETQRILEAARVNLSEAVDRSADISPAGEWLLDNFYVIQEHLREIRASLPRGYYEELPKLASGTLAGYPRVYELAIGLIGDTEGHVEMDNVQLFVREFQRGATLTTGELWAVPTMLRLGLMENIRRMALRTVQRLEEVESADRWAQRLRDSSDAGPAALSEALAAFVSGHPPLTPTFVSRFCQQLRTYQTNFTPLVWLEQWIAEDSLSAEDAIARSNQRLALTQVMIANSITSLRTIARLDWPLFVESASVVEAVLRRDPTGDYPRMTFLTRDHYRHVVEDFAKGTGLEERDVAQRALELAQRAWVAIAGANGAANAGTNAGANGGAHSSATAGAAAASTIAAADRRAAHVGQYLIGDGRPLLEASTRFRPEWPMRLHRATLAHADTGLFRRGHAGHPDAARGGLPAGRAGRDRRTDRDAAAGGHPGQRHCHQHCRIQLLTLLLPPRILPKLDFEDTGIPATCRTAVVVPTLLGSVDAVREALDHLEVQFLANRDDHLQFALLSDFTDASAASREGDGAILDAAMQGVETLNARYPSTAFPSGRHSCSFTDRGCGTRRKACGWGGSGSAESSHSSISYLRGGARDAFSVVGGDTRHLADVRYVITLDSDTVLPRATAPTFVGAMAHPLNRAIYDSGERQSRRRIRHSAAAHRHHAHQREPIAIRRHLFRSCGRRSVHDGCLRRVSGSLRRGQLYREGDLRRRCLRAGDAWTFPREHAAQP